MHISLHISWFILIMGFCKYILLPNKPCWNFLLLAVWTVAMCEPRYFYNQTNVIMTNGVLMKHHNPIEFGNFFHLNLSDQKAGWIALGTSDVHRFGFSLCYNNAYNNKPMNDIQNSLQYCKRPWMSCPTSSN